MGDIRFELLKKKSEIEKAQRLRYKVYVIERRLESRNTHGIEVDEYDKYSYHFGIFQKEKIIAYSRLINGNRISLPISKYSDIESKNNVEVSRMIFENQKKTNSINPILVTGTMYCNMFLFVVKNGFEKIYALVKESHLRALKILYKDLFCVKEIGEGFFYKEEYRVPILIELKSIEDFMKRISLLTGEKYKKIRS